MGFSDWNPLQCGAYSLKSASHYSYKIQKYYHILFKDDTILKCDFRFSMNQEIY